MADHDPIKVRRERGQAGTSREEEGQPAAYVPVEEPEFGIGHWRGRRGGEGEGEGGREKGRDKGREKGRC